MSDPDLILTCQSYYAREKEIRSNMDQVIDDIEHYDRPFPGNQQIHELSSKEKLTRLSELIIAINTELLKRHNS